MRFSTMKKVHGEMGSISRATYPKWKVVKVHNTIRNTFHLSVFGTFAHKEAQTWFFLHETWHKTLFGISFCFEMVRIQNHSHMLKITWYVAILRFFKRFWHFRA